MLEECFLVVNVSLELTVVALGGVREGRVGHKREALPGNELVSSLDPAKNINTPTLTHPPPTTQHETCMIKIEYSTGYRRQVRQDHKI